MNNGSSSRGAGRAQQVSFAALALLSLAATFPRIEPVTYKLPTAPLAYNVQVEFDGFVPVLGGQEGVFDVKIGMVVKGLGPDEEKNPRAESDLTELEVKFNGAPLPFTVDSVRPFFPKNTLSLTPQGKIIKTDAPDVSLPIRLPGLDAKRFPDITYLPIEFPAGELEVGKPFEFKKKFGDSEVSYTVTPTKHENEKLFLSVKLNQTYTTLEDASKNVVTKEEDVFAKVVTTVSGSGDVEFNTARGIVTKSKVVADAVSKVKEVGSEAESERKLKTTVTVALKQ